LAVVAVSVDFTFLEEYEDVDGAGTAILSAIRFERRISENTELFTREALGVKGKKKRNMSMQHY